MTLLLYVSGTTMLKSSGRSTRLSRMAWDERPMNVEQSEGQIQVEFGSNIREVDLYPCALHIVNAYF
jgi:hypothetical protein